MVVGAASWKKKKKREVDKKKKESNKKDREESEQELKDALRARIKIFNDYVGDFANKSGFGESFDLMTKINPKTGKSLIENLIGDEGELGKWQDYFGAITTIAQDAFNLINQASEQRFEKEYQRLEKDKENALRFAGDSESQRLRIEEEYEKRKSEQIRLLKELILNTWTVIMIMISITKKSKEPRKKKKVGQDVPYALC